MEKLLTIIIPTYNMEQYIGKCIDSLLIPEFDAVEVLVVNDGSKDNSSAIAHDYANKYPRSIKVIDKQNANYGSCINAALPVAAGKYVKILDADDTFDNEIFSKFIDCLKIADEDVVITPHVLVNPEGNIVGRSYVENENVTVVTEESFPDYIQMHQIAYRREIFRRFEYHQTERVSYTDAQWAIIPLTYCRTARFIDLPVYRYLVGRDGQTMDNAMIAKSLNNFFVVLEDSIKAYAGYDGSISGRSIFKNLLVQQHEFVYFKVMNCISENTMKLLSGYEQKLFSLAEEIYNDVSEIKYSEEVSFKVFQDIRKKNYPSDYKIPFYVRALLSTRVKLNKLLKKK